MQDEDKTKELLIARENIAEEARSSSCCLEYQRGKHKDVTREE